MPIVRFQPADVVAERPCRNADPRIGAQAGIREPGVALRRTKGRAVSARWSCRPDSPVLACQTHVTSDCGASSRSHREVALTRGAGDSHFLIDHGLLPDLITSRRFTVIAHHGSAGFHRGAL